MSINERKMCVICAWRKNCNKKFSMGEGKINCPDFVEDVTIKKNIEDKDERKNSKYSSESC